MNLNSNSFLDFSHSYLQFTLTNKGGQDLQTDLGVPFFSRLQIMSGGQELEDIQEWSRLYATLLAAQGSKLNGDEHSLTHHDKDYMSPETALAADADDAAVITGVNSRTLSSNPNVNKVVDGPEKIDDNTSRTYNFSIMSAIFNVSKYFPLLLTDQGLDLYFTLNPAVDIGVWGDDPGGDGYELSNVKYIAHEVNLDDGFVNQMKASMQASGGLLSMSSTTYRYYQQQMTTAGQEDFNISCRVKSLKGMIVRPQATAVSGRERFNISTGSPCKIEEAQFRIGSVLYPQEAIKFSNTNKGELFQEIRKCFGTIGSYNHGTMLNNATVHQAADDANIGDSGSTRSLFMIAYDFETFSKSATESGINVSDRALPVTLTIKKNGAGVAGRLDTWAMCDCIIYIDLMGKISTRI